MILNSQNDSWRYVRLARIHCSSDGQGTAAVEAFSLLDGQPIPTKGGKLPSSPHSDRDTPCDCEVTGQPRLVQVSCASQSITLTCIERLLYPDTFLSTNMMNSANLPNRD